MRPLTSDADRRGASLVRLASGCMGTLDFADLSFVGPWKVEVVGSTGSTNADLVMRARGGADGWQALVADVQTAGRGRLTRTWSSQRDTSVSMSVLLRPSRPVSEWALLTHLAGLAVAQAVEKLGAQAVLKWPNDVLLLADEEKKVCGTLAELVPGPTPAVVIGMGINAFQTRGELPVETATSLLLAGVSVTRPQVVTAVLEELAELYEGWELYGWGQIKDSYRRHCITLGRTVRVELPDGTAVSGVAQAICDDGRLQVMTASGPQVFAAGDVHHLRPA